MPFIRMEVRNGRTQRDQGSLSEAIGTSVYKSKRYYPASDVSCASVTFMGYLGRQESAPTVGWMISAKFHITGVSAFSNTNLEMSSASTTSMKPQHPR